MQPHAATTFRLSFYLSIFAGAHRDTRAPRKPVLGLPCNFFDRFAEPLLALAPGGADGGSVYR